MSDASSSYRSRVLRPKKPRNIPFEAEQLLYRFTVGSRNPPKGQSDCFFATSLWDSTSSTPTLAPWKEGPNAQTTEYRTTGTAERNTSTSNIQSPFFKFHFANCSTQRPIPIPVATENINYPSLSPHQSFPSTASTPTSTSSSLSTRPPGNETPRQAPRDQLRKTATVSNANQMTPARIIEYQPQRAGSSRQKKASTRPTIIPTIPRPIASRHTRERDSSSEYQSHQSSRASSGSPAPIPKDSPPRRSSRARRDPITYNVRALVGLELEPAEAEAADRSRGNEASSGASSPRPSNTSLISSTPVDSQTPQSLGSGSSRERPSIGHLLRNRQQGRFISNSYYNHAYTDRLSELTPWRSWKGASNDITSIAWSPDGTRFAAGATTHGGDYNRGNNLVLGDLSRNSLMELPDHWIRRENPTSTQDSRLFATVSSTQWVGEQLYSASFDKTVKMWDIGYGASCVRTLTHDAQVEVMAASKYRPNLLATGTKSGFRLWNLGSLVSYENLHLARYSGQKNVELSPTNLIWGNSPGTRNLLVGGMVQRTDDAEDIHVARYGHLGMWKLEESSVTTIKLSPDSQNIFDIKWHPSMPTFATASSMRDHKSYPPGSQSLVNVYSYNPSASKAIHSHSFACPAVDINETTFCPFGSNHMTASCTDGSTYVWDVRYPNTLLHKLRHGEADYPINHEIRREYADVGVRAALWGTSIDQFYTGASDGFLKQWDIRRATEDALVSNVAKFNDGVMGAVFSPDNAHLLVGDNAGGIHVLSSGPCADPEPGLFNFEYAPVQEQACDNQPEQPSSEMTGVAAARQLLESCQLTINPLYGPVQGPKYSGPFARWPRGIDADAPAESVAQAPLLEEHQLRQFQGPPLKDRNGLDEHSRKELQRVFNLAHACNDSRNAQPAPPQPALSRPSKPQPTVGQSTGHLQSSQKRKRASSHISMSSNGEESHAPVLKKAKRPLPSNEQDKPTAQPIQADIIDLTISDDDDDGPITPRRVKLPPAPSPTTFKMESPEQVPQIIPDEIPDDMSHGELVETPDEALEDDYWWPDSRQVDANIPRRTDG
ncbi:hypothetical protein N7481_000061 [Penicillium waksmanii]|uniref:uncharacterized protein n=1 Tax=Penicillium waksmanii TaxID=69791 RepID=UPI00254793D0|nr:uncharacterized protein N7481_000061 [Penicillium waksmanii]KAJ5999652.1 hypothetical protein N7481_000061 [Penicillium waksmanii]